MSGGLLQCSGQVTIDQFGGPLCSGAWTLVPVPEPFSIEQLDPAPLAEAFGVGFVLVGSCWFAGWACRTLLSLLR